MSTKNWFAKIVIVLAMLSIVTACSPQSASITPQEVESMLIAKEQEKWDLFGQGNFAAASELYADDFINLGFTPAGMVRQNKKETFDMLAQVPSMSGGISLTDFLVVHGDDQSAVVSYKVAAPFGNLYVSSVWAERNGEWKTVFYQASPDSPAAPAEEASMTDIPAFEIPFFGRYKADRSDGGKDAVRFTSNGKYAVDSMATGQYGTTGSFEIKDSLLIFTDDERADVPVCKGADRVGTYEFTYTGNTLTFTKVNDNCVERVVYFDGRTWTK